MKFLIALMTIMLPACASAADWTLRSTDTAFTGARLMARLAERPLDFHDGGSSVYGPGNAYAYIYSDGRAVPGVFRIADDGAVCVDFDNGWSRCDLYVTNGGRLILITEKGDRFPVKQ